MCWETACLAEPSPCLVVSRAQLVWQRAPVRGPAPAAGASPSLVSAGPGQSAAGVRS
jgi:hypothetical protein